MLNKRAWVVTMLVLTTSNVMASGYIGFGIGPVKPGKYMGVPFETSIGTELSAGLDVNSYFALEVSYLNLGKSSDGSTPELEVSTDGISIGAIFKAPVNDRMNVYFKLGQYSWDGSVSQEGYGEYYSNDGSDMFFALGFSDKVGESTTLGMRYTSLTVDDFDPAMFSMNMTFGFDF